MGSEVSSIPEENSSGTCSVSRASDRTKSGEVDFMTRRTSIKKVWAFGVGSGRGAGTSFECI